MQHNNEKYVTNIHSYVHYIPYICDISFKTLKLNVSQVNKTIDFLSLIYQVLFGRQILSKNIL